MRNTSIFGKAAKGLVLSATLALVPLLSQSRMALADTTIVMLIDLEKGKTAADAEPALKAINDYIAKQPNLISEELLKSTYKDQSPAYVHLMKWKDQADWEKLSSDQAFLDLIAKNSASFKIKPAEVFVPVK